MCAAITITKTYNSEILFAIEQKVHSTAHTMSTLHKNFVFYLLSRLVCIGMYAFHTSIVCFCRKHLSICLNCFVFIWKFAQWTRYITGVHNSLTFIVVIQSKWIRMDFKLLFALVVLVFTALAGAQNGPVYGTYPIPILLLILRFFLKIWCHLNLYIFEIISAFN